MSAMRTRAGPAHENVLLPWACHLPARSLLAWLLLALAPGHAGAAPQTVEPGVYASAPKELVLKVTATCSFCERPASVASITPSQPVETNLRYGLDQLVDLTILNHPTVASRRAELLAAQSEVDAARQAFYPSPAAQLQQGRGNQGSVLSLQQPLWTGGRLSAGLNAAATRARATDVSVTEAQLALALRVTSAYEAWLQAHGRLAVLQRSVRQLETYVERIERRVQGGASAAVDRELVVARLAQSQSDLATAEAAERNALAQLSQLSGRSLRPGQVAATASVADAGMQGLALVNDEALARNPALRRIELDIETTEYETEQKRAALWPTVSLRAEHQRSAATAGLPGTKDNRIFVVLEYTPGAGFSTGSQVEASRARTQGLRDSREAARRDLLERVAIDHENFRSGLARQRDLQRTLAASAEVLASYDRLFVAGKRGWLDVLNAARELTQVELAAADIAPQLVGTRYRLRLLAGEQPWLQRQPDAVPAETDFISRIQTAFIPRSQP